MGSHNRLTGSHVTSTQSTESQTTVVGVATDDSFCKRDRPLTLREGGPGF